ncbi:MAG: ATP-binding protein [Peptostreptococcaceae bacterium]
MNCENISMQITSNSELVSIIRLTVSGIANKMGFSIEDIDDIKVCISEACTNAIKHSKDTKFKVDFNIFSNKLEIKVKDDGIGYDYNSLKNPDFNGLKESGMGIFIIKSLMDEVSIESENKQGTTINMTKYLGVDS